jgi:anti-sigma regulatory factor (Ser/Thr protein kinase)
VSDGWNRCREAEWVGEPSAEASGRIRGELHRLLIRWELAEDVVGDAVLIVAELLANVIVHARTRYRLCVRLRGLVLRVEMSDSRVGVPEARSVNPTAGRITGLRLINAVASRWGWQEYATGKTVWVEIFV